MHPNAKIISICPNYFLAGYFSEVLQDYGLQNLFYFTYLCGEAQLLNGIV